MGNRKKHIFLSVLINLFLICLAAFSFAACKHEVSPGAKNGVCISYQSNHGNVPQSVYVKKGTVLTDSLLPKLELKGQEKSYMDVSFGGWQIDGVPVDAEDGYKVESNVVLTGIWMVTINYIVGGNTTLTGGNITKVEGYEWENAQKHILATKKIPENSYLTESYLMELTGCIDNVDRNLKFSGWMIKDNLSKATTDTRVNKSTVTLEALFVWPFTEFVFTSKYSKSPVTKSIYAHPFSFEFSRVYYEPTNDKYNFKGWKLKGTEDSEIISKDYLFPDTDPECNPADYKFEFEAVWEPKQVTLTMYPNNTEDSSANPATAKIPHGVNAQIPDMASQKSWTYVNPNEASKVYRFEGWTLTPYSPDSPEAEIVFNNKDTVVMNEDVALYAYWVTDRLLPVKCSYPSGNIGPNKKIELSTDNPADEVNIFYTTDGRDPTEDSILYDSDIGIVLRNTNELQKIKARAFPVNKETNKSASACSIFKFTVACGLTLNRNIPDGAQVNEEEVTVSVPFGQTYNIPDSIYYCRGYKLLGFAKKSDAKLPDYSLDAEIELRKESTTLYAVWERIYYTLSYSIGDAGYYAPDNIKVPEGYELSVADLPNVTSEFYKFLGWKDSYGNTVKKGYKINSNTELCATWEEIMCKITYSNGTYPVTVPAVKEVPYKSTMKNEYLPNLTINGYWFDGWYMDETEVYYETEGGVDTQKTRTVSKKVKEGDFIINKDITLYTKAHKKYNAMDEVKDDNGKLVAIIIKPSTQNEVAVGVGVKDYYLWYQDSSKKVSEYFINSKTSPEQKYFFKAYIPEIIAYNDLSGDQDGSDNFDIILQYMKANGLTNWTVDQRLYDESPAFYNAVHYAGNEDTGEIDDRTDVYCETYTKYNDGWYIPSIYEVDLFWQLHKKNDLYSKLKAAGKGFTTDFSRGQYFIASSNLSPYNSRISESQGFIYMMAYQIVNRKEEIADGYIAKCKPTPTYQDDYARHETQFIYMRKFED